MGISEIFHWRKRENLMKLLIKNNQLILKKIILLIYDIVAIITASLLALVIRFEGNYSAIPKEYLSRSLQYIVIVIGITLVIFWYFRLYSSLWTYAGATELINIAVACMLSTGVQMSVMKISSGSI